ncbi:unnamed protein product [Lactuca virosa]|uniref:Uncharacterized protein n=1 Tax=Lactuca virosa TaxID=75947 RepID=A0AAU9NE85_9ASTR|nr:unnamed protein product [Lactuca virosa]
MPLMIPVRRQQNVSVSKEMSDEWKKINTKTILVVLSGFFEFKDSNFGLTLFVFWRGASINPVEKTGDDVNYIKRRKWGIEYDTIPSLSLSSLHSSKPKKGKPVNRTNNFDFGIFDTFTSLPSLPKKLCNRIVTSTSDFAEKLIILETIMFVVGSKNLGSQISILDVY